MKNQQYLQQTTTPKLTSILHTQSPKQILCKGKKKSSITCINHLCQNYAFLCDQQQCQCQKQHKGCLAILTKRIKNSIKAKTLSTKCLQEIICDKIQKAINQLSDLRDRISDQFSIRFQSIGLKQCQKALTIAIQNGNVNQISGKKIWQLVQKLSTKNQIQVSLDTFKQQIQAVWESFQQKVSQLSKNLQDMIKEFKNSLQQQQEYKGFVTFRNSKIIKTRQQNQRLNSFFSLKKLRNAKLLFTASQHDFDSQKFHQICDNIPNILTICQTQFGKIIGGYTPIPWNKNLSNYCTDGQKRSFIFTLQNNQKLTINPSNFTHQTYSYTGYGPTFGGGHDLSIMNKSNQNRNSYVNMGYTYIHTNYVYGDTKSHQRFAGARNFKTTEWEVWKVQLQK